MTHIPNRTLRAFAEASQRLTWRARRTRIRTEVAKLATARATVRERCYAVALRGSRAPRTRSRPKTNSSAGS